MLPTCFISLLSLRIPVLSVLVAPVWPISWMEMAGLVVVDWIGRTNGHKITAQTKMTNVHLLQRRSHCWKHLLLAVLCPFLVSANYIS